MTKLIVNADDFGYTEATNYGIIDCHKQGILTSTTIMATMPGFEHAIELAKENPKLGIGVHLVASCGKPLTQLPTELIDENGYFRRGKTYFTDKSEDKEKIDLECMYSEWKTQIERVINAGIKPTHLDGHHHLHTHPELVEYTRKLSEEFDLPVRNCNGVDFGRGVEKFVGDIDAEISVDKPDYEKIENFLKEASQYKTCEVMSHPSYLSKFVNDNSSFNMIRIYHVAALISPEMRKLIEKYNFELVNYGDLNL